MSQLLIIKSLLRQLCRVQHGEMTHCRSMARVHTPWRPRKPMWLPTAPAKVFRIPVHPDIPEDEKQLFQDLYVEYLRKVESIRNLFRVEYKKEAEEIIDRTEELKKAEEEHHRLCMLENEMENERLRAIKEAAMEEILEEKIQNLLTQYEEQEKGKERRKEFREAIIRRAKEESEKYITTETLDQAIEYALDHPVNMNFTIDLQGNITWEGKPPEEYEEKVRRRLKKFSTN